MEFNREVCYLHVRQHIPLVKVPKMEDNYKTTDTNLKKKALLSYSSAQIDLNFNIKKASFF